MSRKEYKLPNGKIAVFEYDIFGIGKITLECMDELMAMITDRPQFDVWCEDCKEYDKEHHNCPRFNRVIRTALEDAGMVSVVRCKECKWYDNGQNESDSWNYCTRHFEHYIDVNDDDYCSYGEREGE